jgi:hypothetical protein
MCMAPMRRAHDRHTVLTPLNHRATAAVPLRLVALPRPGVEEGRSTACLGLLEPASTAELPRGAPERGVGGRGGLACEWMGRLEGSWAIGRGTSAWARVVCLCARCQKGAASACAVR